MERTVENILNETPQFESQYAITVWVDNLSVPELISQLSKYSVNINGKIEELTDRLTRFVALQKEYDEVPWDLSDQNFNFTCEFSQRLQTVISERTRNVNELPRTQYEPQANVSRQSHENTSSPAGVRNSPMQRQEPPLIEFDSKVTEPRVLNSGEPMQQSLRDKTGEQLIEIREPIVENRNRDNRENFNNRVLNGNAPSFVPRVNFALSSTTRTNTETHARTHF